VQTSHGTHSVRRSDLSTSLQGNCHSCPESRMGEILQTIALEDAVLEKECYGKRIHCGSYRRRCMDTRD